MMGFWPSFFMPLNFHLYVIKYASYKSIVLPCTYMNITYWRYRPILWPYEYFSVFFCIFWYRWISNPERYSVRFSRHLAQLRNSFNPSILPKRVHHFPLTFSIIVSIIQMSLFWRFDQITNIISCIYEDETNGETREKWKKQSKKRLKNISVKDLKWTTIVRFIFEFDYLMEPLWYFQKHLIGNEMSSTFQKASWSCVSFVSVTSSSIIVVRPYRLFSFFKKLMKGFLDGLWLDN